MNRVCNKCGNYKSLILHRCDDLNYEKPCGCFFVSRDNIDRAHNCGQYMAKDSEEPGGSL